MVFAFFAVQHLDTISRVVFAILWVSALDDPLEIFFERCPGSIRRTSVGFLMSLCQFEGLVYGNEACEARVTDFLGYQMIEADLLTS